MPQVRVASSARVFRSAFGTYVQFKLSRFRALITKYVRLPKPLTHPHPSPNPNPNPCNLILIFLGRRRNHHYHQLSYSSQARYRLLAPQTSPLFNLHIPIHSRLCASTYLLGSTAIPFLGPIPGILTPSLPTRSGTSICSPV